MGGLAHFIEQAGIATTQISLVRLHSEKLRPPRALWVSFELGRPLGPPNQPEFQHGVLLATLRLLEAETGPVLIDYPLDAPESAGEQSGWSCPISFSAPAEELTGVAALRQQLRDEMAYLRPWYERAVAARGRTSVGASGLRFAELAQLVCDLVDDPWPLSPRDDLPLAEVARLAAEDLKAFYFEAASAQPGDASTAQLRAWFWDTSRAGAALRQIAARFVASDDEALKLTGMYFIVPRSET